MDSAEIEKYRNEMKQKLEGLQAEGEIVAISKPTEEQVSVQKDLLPYKLDTKTSQLAQKAANYGAEAKKDIAGTLDRMFDIYETPNAFQVFWVIALLLTIGIFVLSAIVTVKYGNSFIAAMSAAAMTLLLVGFFGYLVYGPKTSLSTFSEKMFAEKPTKEQKETKYLGAIDTTFNDSSAISSETPPPPLSTPP